jgi:P27 family predicted phage terminase small subunit
LDQYAKSEWRRIAPALAGLGLATAIDRAALAAYCMAWSRVRHAEEMLAKEGHLLVTEHTTKAHPAIAIQMAAIREMRQICGEFGLTPSSRGRLVLPGQRSDSALAEFQDEPTLRVAT